MHFSANIPECFNVSLPSSSSAAKRHVDPLVNDANVANRPLHGFREECEIALATGPSAQIRMLEILRIRAAS